MHLKVALDYIRRAPFQALAAISVLSVTFFVGTVIAILVYSSSQLLNYFETRPQVIAFLKQDAVFEEVNTLQSRLEADPRVKDVSFVSKEQALEIYKNATADNPLLAELVSPTIFPASIEFSLIDLARAREIIDELKANSVVESVGFTASLGGGEASLNEVVDRLKTLTFYIRAGGVALVVVLGATSFLVLMIVIGMRLTTRRGEIETLSLIGAKSGFIRAPIVLEAIIYSATGVFFGWLLALILVLYVTPAILSYFGAIPVLPRDTMSFFLLLLAILAGELVIGVVVALWGSLLAVSRSLKSK
ncbi:MAG: Cell division protein [Candidatus Woesebacteria bacterium GW2011_GWB1_44_11b]|uniref:Cell division protein FtsX n=1 Tax=Candidatus Woesebacteria bacterium GW2011_GWB1_44_11b TaxID=1618580 RepID=A0A0G1GDP9_9BACT|nr:MAG: Cell division protein [Candidatus Woesebacteria bacterium GW2011_GWB1_44_11b]